MNERIRQLAKEAGFMPDNFISRWEDEFEKFTESLIRECITICENENYPKNPDLFDEGWDGGLHCAQERMMNLFGPNEWFRDLE
jgi:hypothetical protein